MGEEENKNRKRKNKRTGLREGGGKRKKQNHRYREEQTESGYFQLSGQSVHKEANENAPYAPLRLDKGKGMGDG